jgi:hypothetical protein
VGNDNTVVWSTLAVSGGEFPYVTFYDGQVSVVMKITDLGVQKLRVYRSADGGYNWVQSADYEVPGHPNIYDIYAYSDAYGTHIVWEDGPSTSYSNEIYYVRCSPQQEFLNFKNVTDIGPNDFGNRPRAAVSGNKASVVYHERALTSRDLNLDTGTWDSFYSSQASGASPISIGAASIGDIFYVVYVGDYDFTSQNIWFTYRQRNATSWSAPSLLNRTAVNLDERRNLLTVADGKLHFISYIWETGMAIRSYTPSVGWGSIEVVEGNTGDQIVTTPFLAGAQFGIYCFWEGTYTSYHQHMRHKAFVPTITLTSPVASGWNMTGIPVALYNLRKAQVYPMVPGSVYRYDGGYIATDPLTNRLGWWASFPSAQDISYTGARIDSMRMIAKNGWNIIGSISSSVPTSSVTTDPPGIVDSYFFKYVQGQGYVITYSLDAGRGHWVRASQNGRIILKASSGLQQGGGELASYDKFTITDANYNQQDLFVRNSVLAQTTESVEMPPSPPDAEFDSRFESGDIVKTVDPAGGAVDLSIAINEAVYPITLTWNINPENGITYSFLSGGLGKSSATTTIAGRGEARFIQSSQRSIVLTGLAQAQHPSRYVLSQNYPNPFNPATHIKFDLPVDGMVSLAVYDVLGRRIVDLVNEYRKAGFHSAMWDASTYASGIYFARFSVTNAQGSVTYSKVNKMVLMK